MAKYFDWGNALSIFGDVGSAVLGFIPGGSIAGGILNSLTDNIGGAISSNYAKDQLQQQQIDAEKRANAEYDRRLEKENELYQERLADERAYNDPTAQAERLRQAGINPISALSGAPAQPQATAVTSPSEGNAKSPGVNPLALSAMAMEMKDIEAGIGLKNAEAQNQKSQASYYDAHNQKLGAETGLLYLQQATERALKDKILEEKDAIALENNFFRAIYQDKVDAFVANANIIKNNAQRSDWEQPYIQQQLFMGMLAQVQGIQLTAQEILNAGQEYYNIIADTNYKNSLSAKARAEIDKMEFDQQLELANFFAQFVLQNNEFINDERLLKMSQEFNADQNKRDRRTDRLKTYLDVAVGSFATLVGGAMVASGAGAPVGAILTSLGLTKLGNAFTLPERSRIGYK